MYRVIKKFKDLQDGDYIYEVGDTYPREGKRVSIDRALQLLGTDNKIGQALIVEETVDEPIEIIEEPIEEEVEEVKPARKKKK